MFNFILYENQSNSLVLLCIEITINHVFGLDSSWGNGVMTMYLAASVKPVLVFKNVHQVNPISLLVLCMQESCHCTTLQPPRSMSQH